MYRTIGYAALRGGKDPEDAEAVVNLLPSLKVELAFAEGEQQVLLNGENVSDRIRTPEVSMAASEVSAMPPVREFLFSLQQNMAKTHDVIMDGRDIGTVVLPQADVKIFLTAGVAVRAPRRGLGRQEKGGKQTVAQVQKDLAQRDLQDSTRAIAPLKQAKDAVVLDTSALDLPASVQALQRIVEEKIGQVPECK